jgi:hypothetical protein
MFSSHSPAFSHCVKLLTTVKVTKLKMETSVVEEASKGPE